MAVRFTLAAAVDAVVQRSASRLALASPFQPGRFERLSYSDVKAETIGIALGLQELGYTRGDVLLSSLPNTAENLLLQIACSRLGVGFATAKNEEAVGLLGSGVRGCVVPNGDDGFLSGLGLRHPAIVVGGDGSGSGSAGTICFMDLIDSDVDSDGWTDPVEADGATAHGFYNSSKPYTNGQALVDGANAAAALGMDEADIVCVSITLCHAFGIGSACSSALMSGAAIALPAVGGISGCGVPEERARASLDTIKQLGCTLVFADSHTLKALPPSAPGSLTLRGGACKVGSGADFLAEMKEYAGIELRTVGNATAEAASAEARLEAVLGLLSKTQTHRA